MADRVGEDSLGVVGDGCSHVADQNAAGFLRGWAVCEFGECRGEGAVGGCLEVVDGLVAASAWWAWFFASCQRPATMAAQTKAAIRAANALSSGPVAV